MQHISYVAKAYLTLTGMIVCVSSTLIFTMGLISLFQSYPYTKSLSYCHCFNLWFYWFWKVILDQTDFSRM